MVKIKLVDLVVGNLVGNEAGKKDIAYDLPNGVSKLVVGRSHGSNIQIFKDLPEKYIKAIHNNPEIHKAFNELFQKVSKEHCIIYQVADKVMVQDNKSKNKTYVNNKQIPEGKAIDLKNGDKISLGKYELEVRIEGGEFKIEEQK